MLTTALQKQAEQLVASGTRLAVATVVRVESPTSSKPGARALITEQGEIHGWIGGGCAQPAVIRAAQRVLQAGNPELVRVTPEADKVTEIGLTAHKSSCKSGGVLDIFIEPFVSRMPLLVLGSSPCAVALAQFAVGLDFDVTLAANGELPTIDGVVTHQGYELDDLNFSQPPYVVVATQGRGDKAALTAASHISSKLFGFVASAKKAAALQAELSTAEGVGPAIDQLIAPFGVDITVKSPQEIAIAALAQLIEHRNSGVQKTTAMEAKAASAPESLEIASPTVKSCCGG